MLWGGRFEEKLNDFALEFSSSLNEDINLILEELECGRAYAEMLCRISLLAEDEFTAVINGYNQIENEWKSGSWLPNPKLFEDIHSAIEARLYELSGPLAGKLRSGRSRNDQIVTSLRLWLKTHTLILSELICSVQKVFVELAQNHIETIIPGYTHLQFAQPVSLAHHLLAYVEMFERDKARLQFTRQQCDTLTLGAAALAGSTLPLDLQFLKEKLNFTTISRNSLDSVSDRDFVLDFLHSASTGIMHLSRLSEELILWSTTEFSFASISDSYTTGSSLMPQKKNPDMAELIRGKSSRLFSNYLSVASMLKGLPLSYNRDMQEDKAPLFHSFNTYFSSLTIIREIFKTIRFDNSLPLEKMKSTNLLATDLADWLVMQGIIFREAHEIVGKLVKHCEKNKQPFSTLKLEDLKSVSAHFNAEALTVLNLEKSLYNKKTIASPNPNLVQQQIIFWKQTLKIP